MATMINLGGGSGKQGFVINDYIQTVNTWTEWKLVGKTNGNQYEKLVALGETPARP